MSRYVMLGSNVCIQNTWGGRLYTLAIPCAGRGCNYFYAVLYTNEMTCGLVNKIVKGRFKPRLLRPPRYNYIPAKLVPKKGSPD